jgi:hypothetical protein
MKVEINGKIEELLEYELDITKYKELGICSSFIHY